MYDLEGLEEVLGCLMPDGLRTRMIDRPMGDVSDQIKRSRIKRSSDTTPMSQIWETKLVPYLNCFGVIATI